MESDRRRRIRHRKITEDDIIEYVTLKTQKKSMKVANKFNKFVWRKKIERDINQGVPLEFFSVKAEKRKQREIMEEIEKLKKRREETAIKKAQREEAMALLDKERARAEFHDWEKKEKEFCFHQSKARSEIRLCQGRIKAIDILSKYVDCSDVGIGLEIDEPCLVFHGLTLEEIEQLRDDIKLYLDLDRATQTRIRYWESLLVVCDWELDRARKKDALEQARVCKEQPLAELFAEQRGLHSNIEADVENFLQGKTCNELEALQTQIDSWMRSGTAKVVEYWEAVLKRLHIYKAKACLKEIHDKVLRTHLEHPGQPLDAAGFDEKNDQPQSPVETEEAEETGSYSPEFLHGKETEEGIDPGEDKAILETKRVAVLEEQQRRVQEALALTPVKSDQDNFEMKAMKAMGAMEEGDEVFGNNDEINLNSQVCWWHNKYRPRKPKFFNRVHTGYEWNKYNRTHYDRDNPPPKIVQGYKFNIFYPDLVDKTKAPTYTIDKDGDSTETCIIRFHAGPPYEDIAFRMVNKEWEHSHKKGFKCTFEKEILQVYFNFKQHRYRR